MTGLLPLDGPAQVPTGSAERFREDGHVCLRGLAGAGEVAAVRPVVERLVVERTHERRPVDERDTYGAAFLQVGDLWRHDETVRAFVCAPRFASAAATLLGVEGVRLYHDQALFKEPRGGHTPWHQDQYYWPLDTTDTITMWMPLAEVTEEVGSMVFVTGSHLLGDLGAGHISDRSQAAIDRLIEEQGLTTDTHGSLEAGDATFHAGWTLHSASPNPSGAMRPVMTVIYVADGARVAEPTGPAQEYDRMAWLGGREPGEPVDSDQNPLLWPPVEG